MRQGFPCWKGKICSSKFFLELSKFFLENKNQELSLFCEGVWFGPPCPVSWGLLNPVVFGFVVATLHSGLWLLLCIRVCGCITFCIRVCGLLFSSNCHSCFMVCNLFQDLHNFHGFSVFLFSRDEAFHHFDRFDWIKGICFFPEISF